MKRILAGLCVASAGLHADDRVAFFESKVRPLLAEHCYDCHGGAKTKGGLALDTKLGWEKGGDSGAAIVPGKPEESLLIKTVSYHDKDLAMPPEKKGGKLPDTDIAVLTEWVKMGAPDPRVAEAKVGGMNAAEAKTWWAFQPLPKADSAPSPAKMDAFMQRGSDAHEPKPSGAVDRRTLIRRATYDLTGLPPTPEEVAAFIADQSADAFAKVIERLLASPQYGVQWGRHWLDVVRYADSLDARYYHAEKGDILDAWRYRDWVVSAFNRDLPYDQFITHQLAGDILATRETGGAFPSPFKFQHYGQSGIEVSELFAKTAQHMDDIAVIRSMQAQVPNHEPSLMLMNCGDSIQTRPSLGSWLMYGLGTENQNLPGFVAMCPGGLPVKGAENWQSAFLPGSMQGTYVDSQHTTVDRLIENIRSPHATPEAQRQQLDLLRTLNLEHRSKRLDPRLDARIESFELAFRMQTEAADAFDVSREPQSIRDLYGSSVHGRQTLIARRLVERGVRFVQLWHGAGQPWDDHKNLAANHRKLAGEIDQPIAALLTDLKSRGMLEDTLVIWGGEFGRTPVSEAGDGRDHNHYGFSVWMAGGGIKGGTVHGSTDEFGFAAAENPVSVHDLHATILHLMGLDHERLTYRYSGRDFRLTDVGGNVVKGILA